MKTELELVQNCIALLAAEGVEAQIIDSEIKNYCIRIPAWETPDSKLCWRTVFQFIHKKLGGNSRNGLVAKTPITGFVEVYTYDPRNAEDGLEVTADDILHWGYGKSVDEFNWENVETISDNGWEDGFGAHIELSHVTLRVGFLSTLLNCEVVELPLVKPLTPQDLLHALNFESPSGIYGNSKKHSEILLITLSSEGQLVVYKRSDKSETPVGDEHFDKHGRMVFEGEVIKHRIFW